MGRWADGGSWRNHVGLSKCAVMCSGVCWKHLPFVLVSGFDLFLKSLWLFQHTSRFPVITTFLPAFIHLPFWCHPWLKNQRTCKCALHASKKKENSTRRRRLRFAVGWRMSQYAALLASKYHITRTFPRESIRVLYCLLHHAMMSWILKLRSATGYRW